MFERVDYSMCGTDGAVVLRQEQGANKQSQSNSSNQRREESVHNEKNYRQKTTITNLSSQRGQSSIAGVGQKHL